MDAAVNKFLEEGGEYVILGGGDGTISTHVPKIIEQKALLGVLPTGTGNAFARDLNIPTAVGPAARVLAQKNEQLVDIGLWDEKVFLNLATVGATSKIADALDPSQKRTLGFAAYLAALAKIVTKVRPFHLEMVLDGQQHEMEAVQWVLGNGRYHAGPFELSPDATLDEGTLHGYAVVGNSVASLLKYGAAMTLGRHLDAKCVHGFSAREGSLTCRPARRVVLDGELSTRTPGKFRVQNAALRVVTG